MSSFARWVQKRSPRWFAGWMIRTFPGRLRYRTTEAINGFGCEAELVSDRWGVVGYWAYGWWSPYMPIDLDNPAHEKRFGRHVKGYDA
jgi:hypothetical protein